MTTDKNRHTEYDDPTIGQWLKKRLPDAPPQPWFTRTVMNRLPDRGKRIASTIECILYITGMATCSVTAIRYYNISESAGGVTGIGLMGMLGLIAMAGVMAYGFIAPWVMPRH